MKCLVTGSEGFIGKNLVKLLEDEGHLVFGYDLKKGAHSNYLNVVDTDELRKADVVYHLACVNQMAALDDPAANILYNAQGARILANWAAEIGAKFVYTSTASVYGNAEVIPTPVDAKLQPLTDYAVAKLAGEFFVQNSGADWTILRLSNVYGPHQTVDNPYCGVIGRFFDQARKGEPFTIIGDGLQSRDFTYVNDVVKQLYRAGGNCDYPADFRHRIFNCSHGQEVTIGTLSHLLSTVTEETSFRYIDKRPIDGVKRRCLDSKLHCPTTLLSGLEETWEWFNEQA